MMHLPFPWKPLSLLALLLVLLSSEAAAETKWLSVLASEGTLHAAVKKLRSLKSDGKGLQIISSDDCKNLHQGLFLVVSGIWQERSDAEKEAAKWRTRKVKDAYPRACTVVPDSRLDLGVPVLDPSIYERPPDTVNWTYEDAMSRVKGLSNSLVGIIQPRYEPSPEDVREGLKMPVYVITKPGAEWIRLRSDCIDPEVTAEVPFVAVSCVNATMADHLLHVTRVYQIPSRILVLERERCREPRLSANQLICRDESLDKEGNLRLESRNYPLSSQ